ncbi:MAG: DUF935 domain-containing protein [Bacteroidales bacterium]|nr:DUF935 domain-containing protein [Bacteroidales bacterium]
MAKERSKVKPVDKAALMPKTPGARYRGTFDIQRWRSAIQRATDPTHPDRSLLYNIYEDILLDLHLTAVTEKRIEDLKGSKIRFVDRGKEIQEINWLIEAPWFYDMLSEIMEARLWGYTASWLDLSGGEFQKYELLCRHNVIPERGLFVRQPGDREGTSIVPPSPYANYVITAGKADSLGLLLKAAPVVYLKRGDISDWATFNEMFAAPIRKGTYPPYDAQIKKELFEAIEKSGGFQALLHPAGTELDIMQASSGGAVATYLGFANFCDKQLSKAFLLNTMTMDAEGGQYKGDIHADGEKLVLRSDRRFVLAVLNTELWRLLEAHGFKPGNGKFVCDEEETLSLKDRMEVDREVAKQVIIPPVYWYERYGIPVPEDGPQAALQPAFPTWSASDPMKPTTALPTKKITLRSFFV